MGMQAGNTKMSGYSYKHPDKPSGFIHGRAKSARTPLPHMAGPPPRQRNDGRPYYPAQLTLPLLPSTNKQTTMLKTIQPMQSIRSRIMNSLIPHSIPLSFMDTGKKTSNREGEKGETTRTRWLRHALTAVVCTRELESSIQSLPVHGPAVESIIPLHTRTYRQLPPRHAPTLLSTPTCPPGASAKAEPKCTQAPPQTKEEED